MKPAVLEHWTRQASDRESMGYGTSKEKRWSMYQEGTMYLVSCRSILMPIYFIRYVRRRRGQFRPSAMKGLAVYLRPPSQDL
jgi:hypothetical protein